MSKKEVRFTLTIKVEKFEDDSWHWSSDLEGKCFFTEGIAAVKLVDCELEKLTEQIFKQTNEGKMQELTGEV